MRYIHLRIANYRGVSEADVDFAETGITVVRGPNEVGKTSLGEAIWLLFEYPDSSKNQDICAIRPVHRDEGPEIELEAESGPYRFIYSKRYFKKPETKLTIIKPKAESLTSRPAHERAKALLQDTLDIDLWKALSVRQGAEINQPILKGQTWLSEALDQAAGGHSIDQRSESLFEAVHQEYLKYFTENGADKKEILEHRKVLANCQSDVQRIEKAMQELEHDIDLAVGLKRELGQLKYSEQEIVRDMERRSAKLAQVSQLELSLSDAKLKLQLAKEAEKSARVEKNDRAKLIRTMTLALNATNEMDESCKSGLISLSQANKELKKAQDAFSDTEGKKKEIQKLIDLYQRDNEYFGNMLYLEQLSERKTRIDKARESAAKSEAILTTNKVNEEALASIEETRDNVISATAKLEAKSSIVLLRGLNKCKLTKDETVINLRKGDEFSFPVSDNIRFVIPEMLEIQVNAGSSIDTLLKKVEDAKSKLNDVCASWGITDADKAFEAFEKRQQASRQIVNLKQVEKENLRDLTYERLSGLLLELQQSVPAYLPTRVLEPKILDDQDLIKAELKKLEKQKHVIENEWVKAKSTFDGAKEVQEQRNRQYIEAKAKLDISKDGLDNYTEMLERERAVISDEVISSMLVSAERTVEEVQTASNTIEASLKALNPEREKELDTIAKESLSRIHERMGKANTELIEVNTRLKSMVRTDSTINLLLQRARLCVLNMRMPRWSDEHQL